MPLKPLTLDSLATILHQNSKADFIVLSDEITHEDHSQMGEKTTVVLMFLAYLGIFVAGTHVAVTIIGGEVAAGTVVVRVFVNRTVETGV